MSLAAVGDGGCTPTVHVFENHDSEAPNGVVTGPKIFGGCTELCLESKFVYSTMDGRDIGRVRKLVPSVRRLVLRAAVLVPGRDMGDR